MSFDHLPSPSRELYELLQSLNRLSTVPDVRWTHVEFQILKLAGVVVNDKLKEFDERA